MEALLITFIAVTSAAVVLQTLILAGMYASTRKMVERMNALLPLVEKVRGVVDESTPKIQTLVSNLSETAEMVRAQAGKVDEAMTEILDIARTQAGNAGELAARTMERVDMTAAAVQRTVTSPARHLTAMMDGVAAGFTEFMGRRKEKRSRTVPKEDMFI